MLNNETAGNEIKLPLTFPSWYFFISPGIMIILPIFSIIFIDNKIYEYLLSVFLIIFGIYLFIIFFGANILRKTGYTINKDGILFFNLFRKKMFLWEEIISYNITGDEKSGDLFLNFQTKNNKNAIRISSKLYKIKMEELTGKINEIKGSISAF